jgi:hypothetical protein
MKTELVTVDQEIMSGEPLRNLIDYLSTGHTLEDFLNRSPRVKRRQAIGFLEQSSTVLLEQVGVRRKAA